MPDNAQIYKGVPTRTCARAVPMPPLDPQVTAAAADGRIGTTPRLRLLFCLCSSRRWLGTPNGTSRTH